MNINQYQALQSTHAQPTTEAKNREQGHLKFQGILRSVMCNCTFGQVTERFFHSAKALFIRSSQPKNLSPDGSNLQNMSYRQKINISRTINSDLNQMILGSDKLTKEHKELINKNFTDASRIFLNRRFSFAMKDAELNLQPEYLSERDLFHRHPYSREPVRYMRDASEQKVTLQNGRLSQITNLDGETVSPGESHRNIIFVRSNSARSIKNAQTYVAEKKRILTRRYYENTHHSSFNQGNDVVSAGMLHFDETNRLRKVSAKSGHYQPNDESMYKFAELGAQSGQFTPEDIIWTRHDGSTLDMSLEFRMKAVLKWAKKHPKSSEPGTSSSTGNSEE